MIHLPLPWRRRRSSRGGREWPTVTAPTDGVRSNDVARDVQRLIETVADRLTTQQLAFARELREVGELGLALEFLADWLSEDEYPVSHAERAEFARLSGRLGNLDRVMHPIADCPLS